MMNKVILIGRAGKEPDVVHLESGMIVGRFTLATNEKFKNRKGEMVEKTEWHNVVVYGRSAEIAEQYLKTGSLLYVEGKIRTRSYEKDGQKRYYTEVVASSFRFLSGASKSDMEQGQETVTTKQPEPEAAQSTLEPEYEPAEDDLPF